MQRVVLEQRLGFVATVTAEGRPNLSPKGTTTLWDEEHLMFADLASPGTIENLATHPHRRDKRRRPDPAQGLPLQGNSRRLYEWPNVRSRVGDPAGSWVNGHPRSGAFDRGDRRGQCRTGGVARLRRWHLGGDHRPALASALRTPLLPAARLAA